MKRKTPSAEGSAVDLIHERKYYKNEKGAQGNFALQMSEKKNFFSKKSFKLLNWARLSVLFKIFCILLCDVITGYYV